MKMKGLFGIFIILGIISLNCFGMDELQRMRASGELRKSCSKRGAAPQPKNRVNTTSRLIDLRKIMKLETHLSDKPIDAYIVTSGDEHQTEYVAEYDRRREYISGFSGSYGTAVITQKKAALWTDGRYFLQADDQLNCDWLLMRKGQNLVPTTADWLKSELKPGSRIGGDPKLISEIQWTTLEFALKNSSLELVEIQRNLIDSIWKNHHLNNSEKDVFVLDVKYAGKNWMTKVDEVKEAIKSEGADAMVVTSLSEIAWLLNIRGRDIPYNPFVKSYVIISKNEVRLYVDNWKLTKNNIVKHLNIEYGVRPYSVLIRKYEDIWSDLPTLCQSWDTVLIPTFSVFSLGASHAIANLVPPEKRFLSPSPIINLKAEKNMVEREGMRNAHIRDAAAMCKFFAYFEKRCNEGDEFTEMDVAKLIDEYRFEQNLSLGNSFCTIAAFGPNGALPHYEPTISTNTLILTNSTLVLDSGGQYYDGTTDVTRTLHLGTPTPEQKRAYTRVLMGSIQLSSLKFPSSMKINVADVMARAPLWDIGYDYQHGTGHGVGSFLGVHESPIALHYQNNKETQVFIEGYFLSNEPGYYNEGDFGVRLENVMEVIPMPWLQDETTGNTYLGFKDVTLIPYEPKLIDLSLLSFYHRRWLNDYNIRIRELVGAELKKQNRMEGFYWMMEKTKLIPEYGHASTITRQSLLLLVANVCFVRIIINVMY